MGWHYITTSYINTNYCTFRTRVLVISTVSAIELCMFLETKFCLQSKLPNAFIGKISEYVCIWAIIDAKQM